MFGRNRGSSRTASLHRGSRHGRREPRSSLSGPSVLDPNSRVARFEAYARAAVELLQSLLPADLEGVQFGFQTVPTQVGDSESPMLYSIDRESRTIILYRMPIQRARGLHVDDEEHRRYFIEHCAYIAVCEYLGREPWELLPGRFDHF